MLSIEYNIHYKACLGSLIYLFYTKVDLCFVVHKLAKFSSNTGKLQLKCLLHLFRYIRDNKNLGLKYYDKIEDATLSDVLIQASVFPRLN